MEEDFLIESDEPQVQHTLRRPFKLEESLADLQQDQFQSQTDVIFYCNKGGIVTAHAAYLQAHSPLLRNIFSEQGSMKIRILSVEDWTVKEVRNALQVLYTGYAGLESYKEGSSVRSFLQELRFDGIFKITQIVKDVEIASTKPMISYYKPIKNKTSVNPKSGAAEKSTNVADNVKNNLNVYLNNKLSQSNRSSSRSSSLSTANDSETTVLNEDSSARDYSLVELPELIIPKRGPNTTHRGRRGGARSNRIFPQVQKKTKVKEINETIKIKETTNEDILKIKALTSQLKVDMTKNNQINTYTPPKSISKERDERPERSEYESEKERSKQKKQCLTNTSSKEKSSTPPKNPHKRVRYSSAESLTSEQKKARTVEKPGCPEVLNDDRKYKDKDWFWKQATRCQYCEIQCTTPVDASNCVIGHGLLRCYVCFALVKDTERLFEHFKNSHKKSVFPGRENCLVCPMCDASVPYKSVSCHFISLHLNSRDKKEAKGLTNGRGKKEVKEVRKITPKVQRTIEINVDGEKLILRKKEMDQIQKYTLVGKSITGREKTFTIMTKR